MENIQASKELASLREHSSRARAAKRIKKIR
jgi:hypothetical protein